MPLPSSTYRIQFHKGFTLRDLQRIVQYLDTLGIDTVYASPIMQAVPGSMHGYDVTDPHTINPEIGNLDDLKALARDLRKRDMCWLQDIVPNHMAFHITNFRLMDVLERGPGSPYYRYFDIDWDHQDEDLKGKVMVPFLADKIDACIAAGQIKLSLAADGFKVAYFETEYPLSLPCYNALADDAEIQDPGGVVSTILRKIPAAAADTDRVTWQATKQEYIRAITQEESQMAVIERMLTRINDDQQQLLRLLEFQHYRLCFWKETDRRINYRRFFTVNELICLRMEDDDVFEEYHTTLFKLFKDKLIDGFRIDHIDGLQDPAGYTRQLRSYTHSSTYIIAEKILEAKEDMPAQWPLQGTSGYEFLSFLNQLLTYRKGARQLLSFYQDLVPDMPGYHRLIFESKRLILENYICGEWDNLTRLFRSSGLAGNFDDTRVRSALGLFMLALPVYRIYPDRLPLRGKSLITIHEALDKALKEGPAYKEELTYLRHLFTTPPAHDEQHARSLHFLKRLMQFTGPLTAKGVEDTTFYIYNPLISHDEVGDSPAPLGMTLQRFHEKMLARQRSTPLSLNATATHDTKRGEDARVRISVLSRIPEQWKLHVAHWLKLNEAFHVNVQGRMAPEINDEYFIYQSMLGGFPEDFQITQEWISRVQAYLNKALREAKVHTNWSEPDEAYEKACEDFIRKILDPAHTFMSSFLPFVRTVCDHALVYSLTQTLIKLTAPGIPDIYQGCELWDLSFVDPDNRRPVDYERRMEFLFQLVIREEQGKASVLEYLRDHRWEGIEKLYVIWKILNFRRTRPLLFTEGHYIPVAITGKDTTAGAYARTNGTSWVVVIFPFGLITHQGERAADDAIDQFVILPEDAPEKWYNLFTGEAVDAVNQVRLGDAFKNFPVAFLVDARTYADVVLPRRG